MTVDEEHEIRVKKLEKRLRDLTIVGAHGVLVSGHFEQGYNVDVRRRRAAPTGTTGACCLPDGSCANTTQSNCESLGGIYQGDGTVCSPDLCPAPTEGACCLANGVCVVETEAQCISDGGVFQGVGTDCTPNPCPGAPTGACCHGETCDIETQSDCEGSGGFYLGDETTCDPNPCGCITTVPVSVLICFSYPYAIGSGCCILSVNTSVSDQVNVDCPLDPSISGVKASFGLNSFGVPFTASLLFDPCDEGCAPNPSCTGTVSGYMQLGVNNTGGFFWDADTGEWVLQPYVHFPNWLGLPRDFIFSEVRIPGIGTPVNETFGIELGEGECPNLCSGGGFFPQLSFIISAA